MFQVMQQKLKSHHYNISTTVRSSLEEHQEKSYYTLRLKEDLLFIFPNVHVSR